MKLARTCLAIAGALYIGSSLGRATRIFRRLSEETRLHRQLRQSLDSTLSRIERLPLHVAVLSPSRADDAEIQRRVDILRHPAAATPEPIALGDPDLLDDIAARSPIGGYTRVYWHQMQMDAGKLLGGTLLVVWLALTRAHFIEYLMKQDPYNRSSSHP